jgi:hypothetical protein
MNVSKIVQLPRASWILPTAMEKIMKACGGYDKKLDGHKVWLQIIVLPAFSTDYYFYKRASAG